MLQDLDFEGFEKLLAESMENGNFEKCEREKNLGVSHTSNLKRKRSQKRVDAKTLHKKKIKKGSTLDLHSCTQKIARDKIMNLINERKRIRGQQVVRIITGRGANSENGISVLKEMAYELLQDLESRRTITRFILEATGGSFIVQIK